VLGIIMEIGDYHCWLREWQGCLREEYAEVREVRYKVTTGDESDDDDDRVIVMMI